VLMRRREWGDLPVYCVVGGVFEAWSGIAAVDEQLYITALFLNRYNYTGYKHDP
jgi:hypothetical protein